MQYYEQPKITPKSTPGGGDARPPYLQMRNPTPYGSKPVVTPKPTAVPGENRPMGYQPGTPGYNSLNPWQRAGVVPQTPQVTPKSNLKGMVGAIAGKPQVPQAPAAPAQPQQGDTLNDLYKFYKQDLTDEKNAALANATTDAAARGVYYGTPLTTSKGDIETQFLRGLGQLQAGMFQNQQQDQLARLGLATQLGWQNQMGQPPAPGPLDLSGIGSIFASNPVASERSGPVPQITPKQRTGDKLKPKTETF